MGGVSRGQLTKLFGFGLSIMEKMAVVKIVTDARW